MQHPGLGYLRRNARRGRRGRIAGGCENKWRFRSRHTTRTETSQDARTRAAKPPPRFRKTVSENNSITSGISFIYDGYMQIAAFERIGGTNGAGATGGGTNGVGLTNGAVGTNSIAAAFRDQTEQTAARRRAMRQNGEMFFHSHDLTKNIIALVDPNGAIVESCDHDAFGNPDITRRATSNQPANPAASTTSSANNRFLFSSEYHDSEPGAFYYNFRHCNPDWMEDGRAGI